MQEFQARKARQDLVLDDIEMGLGNLQNIAKDMGGEMQKQDVLVDEIDTNVRLCFPSPCPGNSWGISPCPRSINNVYMVTCVEDCCRHDRKEATHAYMCSARTGW